MGTTRALAALVLGWRGWQLRGNTVKFACFGQIIKFNRLLEISVLLGLEFINRAAHCTVLSTILKYYLGSTPGAL
jgi:hypothetical protein